MKNFRLLCGIILIFNSLFSFSQSFDKNYQRKQIPRMQLSSCEELESAAIGEKNDIIIYSDGIDRTLAAISRQSSPGSNDEITFFKYDAFGRLSKQYLSYTQAENDGSFLSLTTATSKQAEFYQKSPKVAHTDYPFAKTIFEESPLQKVVESGAAGYWWQPERDHTTQFEYTFNQAATIIRWEIDQSGNDCYTDGYFDANELFVKSVKDPDWEQGDGAMITEYRNKTGQLILKKQYVSSTKDLFTYYVYDDFGNLRFIIPPKAITLLVETPPVQSNTSALSEDLIYSFTYDSRQRLVIKKIPGKDEEYFVYDHLDRIVLYQDGNLRSENKWKFIKYEVHNRPLMAGLLTDQYHINLTSMQDEVSSFYDLSTSQLYEQPYYGTNHIHNYTNLSFPTIVTNGTTEINQVLYYDNYSFDTQNQFSFNSYTSNLEISPSSDVYGLNTALKNKVTIDGQDIWLFTVLYYDSKYRVIREFRENHMSGYDYTDIQYDWSGLPVFSDYIHNTVIDNQSTDIIVHWRYVYDHIGRLTEVRHSMDNSTEFIMLKQKYNELGQVIEKNYHSEDGINWWQSVDFKYNILGWLTNINQSNLSNDNTIIELDQELEPDEMVTGLIYDSLYLNIAEEQYGGSLEKYLNVSFQDKKQLEIANIDDPSQTRYFQLNESKSKILEEKITDSLRYDKLSQLKNISFSFALHSLEFDASASQSAILDSLNNILLSQLVTIYGINDSLEQHHCLTELTDFSSSSVAIINFNEDRDDLFGMDILYDEGFSELSGTQRFNGNISGFRWQSAGNPGIRGYGIQYDHLNQFTQALYAEKDVSSWSSNVGRYDVFNLGYDENGNILHLYRNGLTGSIGENATFGAMDRLTYTYDGNRLKAVEDAISNTGADNNDFKDNGVHQTIEYEYDLNGSLTSDDNKGIASITYNHLNLPVEILFTNNRKIDYLYDASGQKLRQKITYEDLSVETWDYCGGMIYKEEQPEILDFGFCRAIRMPDNHFYYQYYMTDHLGNIRLVFADMDGDHEVEVVQENHFYPFGLTMGGLNIYSGTENKRLYQGKELEDKEKLHWYDFHARRFDSQIGRWHAIDPVLQFVSPYIGMGNNPVGGIDPNGKAWVMVGYQWFSQAYVDGEPIGDPKPGEKHYFWGDNSMTTGGYNMPTGSIPSSGYSSGGGGGQGISSGYSGTNGQNWGNTEGNDPKNQNPTLPDIRNSIQKLLDDLVKSLVRRVEIGEGETAAEIADIVPDAIGVMVEGSFIPGHGASQQLMLVYVNGYGWALVGNTSGGFGWDISLSGEILMAWSDNPDFDTFLRYNVSTSGNIAIMDFGITASYFQDFDHLNMTIGNNWKGFTFGVSVAPPLFQSPYGGKQTVGYSYLILRLTKP